MFLLFEIFWISIFTIITCGIILLNIHLYKMRQFWPKRNFHFVGSKEIGGMLWNIIKGVNLIEKDAKFYNLMKNRQEPCAGYLEFANPVVFISNIELAKNIMIKDFDHFEDRRDFKVNKLDPLAAKMLFFLEGDDWKEMRIKMSPTFTSCKVRRMFEMMNQSGQRLVDFINEEIKKSNPTLNLENPYGKYAIDVVATAVFGIESSAFDSEKISKFEKMAKILQNSFSPKKIFAFFIAPKIIVKFFNLAIFNHEASGFFYGSIMNTINYRKQTKEKRHDFIQLMLEARDEQQLEQIEDENSNNIFEKDTTNTTLNFKKGNNKSKIILTDDAICTQSIQFFFAGFDPPQGLMLFASYQLAIFQEAQEKLAKEVEKSWIKNGSKFTYESIHEMDYLDKFVSETLRMYPPSLRLERRCTKDYKVPDTNLIIPKGALIVIPCYSFHHDEKFYSNPSKFDPERFSIDEKTKRSSWTYMPFGHGPRNCIGMRFSLTQCKVALAHIVRNFRLQPCEKTPIPMKLLSASGLKPYGGMWLNIKPRITNTI